MNARTTEVHVLRGGSWLNNAYGSRASYRYFYTPDYRTYFVGFRCARNKTEKVQ